MDVHSTLDRYKRDMLALEVEAASPHKLIQMLFEGALSRIALAKHFMHEKNIAKKGENISSAIGIIAGLQGSLDFEAGGEIAKNLDALYNYMMNALMQANISNDEEKLDNITQILIEIKSAWDSIGEASTLVADNRLTIDDE